MSIGKYGGWFLAGLFALLWLGDEDTSEKQKTSVKPPVIQTNPAQPSRAKPQRTSSPEVGRSNRLASNEATRLGKAELIKRQPTKPEHTAQTMYVDASRLNVRRGPGKTFKSVWTVKRDEAVRVVSQSGQWKEIKGDRYSGWVFGTYLTAKPSGSRRNQEPKVAAKASVRMTTAAIKKLLIKRSKAYYSGSCPCPYNVTRSGRRCGGNSAYSRPGGASPLCYESDVSAAMVAEFRARL